VLIRPRVDPALSPGHVDRGVREIASRGESLYVLDADLLIQLAPDLIITQDLCHVCAASPEDLGAVLARLPQAQLPRVITFAPHSLAEVWDGIREIADAVGHAAQGAALSERLACEVAAVADAVKHTDVSPRVLCLEWFDPPFVAGHWVPEMVSLAGGKDVLGHAREPSIQVAWQDILNAQPDVIVLMSCGYSLARNLDTWRSMPLPEVWADLPAVRAGRVYAVDANGYFSRSGPRLAPGVRVLASLFHPQEMRGTDISAIAARVLSSRTVITPD